MHKLDTSGALHKRLTKEQVMVHHVAGGTPAKHCTGVLAGGDRFLSSRTEAALHLKHYMMTTKTIEGIPVALPVQKSRLLEKHNRCNKRAVFLRHFFNTLVLFC
jgi:hypothetical protein